MSSLVWTLPNGQSTARWAVPTGGAAELPAGGTTGQVLTKASDADQDVEWASGGGSQPGAVRVLKFEFDYTQAVTLADGVAVATLAAGDILLDAWIVTPLADVWVTDQVGAMAEIGVIDTGAWIDSGFFGRSVGAIVLSDATWDETAPFLRYSHSFSTAPPSLLGDAISSGAGAYCDPRTVFTGSATLSLVVSDDGTPSGDPTDATAGASTLYIMVCTPGTTP